ncbi:MAG: TolC family protein [Bacteroidota bacterium]
MKKYLPFLVTLLVSVIFLNSVKGQGKVLDAYVEEGLSQNLEVVKSRLAIQKQQLKAVEANRQFRPTIDLKSDYLLAVGGRDIAFPIGDLFNPIHGTLNDLSGADNFPTNLENVNEQFLPNNFHDTRFVINQPIINPSIYYNQKIQEQLIGVEEEKMNVVKLNLKQQIKETYYNYLKTSAVLAIYDSTQLVLEELLRVNEKLVQFEKATEDVVYSVKYELQLLESQRRAAFQDRYLAQSFFNLLLNKPLDSEIIEETKAFDSQTVAMTTKVMLETAFNQRPELKQIRQGIDANLWVEKLQSKANQPTLGAQANLGFQGFGFDLTEQAYGTVGLGFSWKIFDNKINKNRIEQAQINTMELQQDLAMAQQQIELQVRDAWFALQTAQQKLKAEEASLISAERSFDIIQKKYKADQAILIEYLDARNKVTNSRIAVSISQFDVLIRQSALESAIAN